MRHYLGEIQSICIAISTGGDLGSTISDLHNAENIEKKLMENRSDCHLVVARMYTNLAGAAPDSTTASALFVISMSLCHPRPTPKFVGSPPSILSLH